MGIEVRRDWLSRVDTPGSIGPEELRPDVGGGVVECAARGRGACGGPVAAELVIRVEAGGREIASRIRLPLCSVHAHRSSVHSWYDRFLGTLSDEVAASLPREQRIGFHIACEVILRDR